MVAVDTVGVVSIGVVVAGCGETVGKVSVGKVVVGTGTSVTLLGAATFTPVGTATPVLDVATFTPDVPTGHGAFMHCLIPVTGLPKTCAFVSGGFDGALLVFGGR